MQTQIESSVIQSPNVLLILKTTNRADQKSLWANTLVTNKYRPEDCVNMFNLIRSKVESDATGLLRVV